MRSHVLVIGGTLLDAKGIPEAGLEPGTSNPAKIRFSRGGTARNVAENLARLGAEVQLISAVGDDASGRLLLRQTAEAGVHLDHTSDSFRGQYGGVSRSAGQKRHIVRRPR